MKTFKQILEALPPHLQGKFSDKMGATIKDVTPSFEPNKFITVYGVYRKTASDIMKKEKIKFSSGGSSSNKFSFSDPKMYTKALDAFEKEGIKIADKEG